MGLWHLINKIAKKLTEQVFKIKFNVANNHIQIIIKAYNIGMEFITIFLPSNKIKLSGPKCSCAECLTTGVLKTKVKPLSNYC